MQELLEVTGIVIKSEPQGEYDRRVSLLTKEMGKVTVFARSARRCNSRLVAATNLFSFGRFRLYPGKSTYTLTEAEITCYFEPLRGDYMAACYGMYFLEVADYYAKENTDSAELLKLLFQSLRALGETDIPKELIRTIFELKVLVVEGEYPGVPEGDWNPDTVYAIEYIASSSIQKLYTFMVSGEVAHQMGRIAERYRKVYMDTCFRSLAVLKQVEGCDSFVSDS